MNKGLIYIIKGKSYSGKTTEIINNILEKNSKNPFSYTFIGPNGNYVKAIKEKCMSKIKSIVSSNYFTIDQFAVELYKKTHPDLLFVNNEIMLFEISRILSTSDLKVISRSNNVLEFLYKMINDVKENNGFENIFSDYEDSYVFFLKNIFETIQMKMRKNKTFDTFDAYLKISDSLDAINFSEYGEALFIDGFNDFSKAHQIFIEAISNYFSEVYLSFPFNSNKKNLYYSTKSFTDLFNLLKKKNKYFKTIHLKEQFFNTNLSTFKKTLFSDNPTYKKSKNFIIKEFKTVNDELSNIAKDIKKKLIDGISPEDLSVVIPKDINYKKQLERKLDELDILYSSMDQKNLENSKIIKWILAPLECLYNGFSPNSIMSLFDLGYSSNTDNSQIYEKIAIDSNIYFDFEFSSLKKRKRSFELKLARRKSLLNNKLKVTKNLINDDFIQDEIEILKKEIKNIEIFKKDIDSIFKLLEEIDFKKIDVRNFKSIFAELYKKINRNMLFEDFSINENTKNEVEYINVFFEKLLPDLEKTLIYLNYKEISPILYYEYLRIFLHSKNFKLHPSIENRISIANTSISRFEKIKYKYFIGFTDDFYPSVNINPFYSYLMYERNIPKDFFYKFENQEKFNLYLSLINTDEKIILSYPTQTTDGGPILKSIYLNEIEKYSMINKKKEIKNEEKYVFSKNEIELYLSKNYNNDNWLDLLNNYDMTYLKSFLKKENDSFSWNVNNNLFLNKKINNNYSFSKLNSYDKCSFLFFLQYIISLKNEYPSQYELNPLEEGILYHNVLKDYYSGVNLNESIKNNLSRLTGTINEEIYNYEFHKHKIIIENFIFKKEMKKIPKISTKLKPKYFELPFGSKNNKPIAISKIFLNGKIDRIDKEENNIYLIDYKRKDNGETKQLILYSLALEKMFPEMNLIGGVFKPIKTSKNYFKNFIVFEDENDKFFKFKNKEITKKEIIKWVDDIHNNIFKGYFEPSFIDKPNICFNCPFKNISYILRWINDFRIQT